MHYIPFIFNRLLGRETVIKANMLGVPVRLGVEARREIKRAHDIAHEAALVERIWGNLANGDVLYDVGANIGVISLLMAMCPAGAGCRLHSFEPEPRNFRRLARNIE